jgi:branched-chain amino acid transport system ATP-binding protein
MSSEKLEQPKTTLTTAEPLLKIDKINVAYGDVQVLWETELEVRRGEIVALVGSNGAGKTTLLSTISGLLTPRAGAIIFNGKNISGIGAQAIVEAGISHVPEGRRLFGALSVKDNLLMGAYRRKDHKEIEGDLEHVLELFPRIKERLNSLAGKLSGGEQQMVAIGRGMMARPSLLMIDELSLGLAPVIIESLLEIIHTVNQEGTTILIVEQDVQTALEQANRGYVLETGQVILSGDSASLLEDDRVKKAYLGL